MNADKIKIVNISNGVIKTTEGTFYVDEKGRIGHNHRPTEKRQLEDKKLIDFLVYEGERFLDQKGNALQVNYNTLRDISLVNMRCDNCKNRKPGGGCSYGSATKNECITGEREFWDAFSYHDE